MRAFRIATFGEPPRFDDVPVPVPGPGQILVKVAGVGLCHSDITMMQIDQAIADMLGWAPFTLGHETAGWIAALGESVGESAGGAAGLSVGDPVAVVSPTSCGACDACREGAESRCPNGHTGRGYGRDGGLAEYVLVDSARALVPLGDLDPVTAGPLTDAGATAMHAVQRVLPRLVEGATVAIIGVGGLGLYALQFLKALTSASIVAIDTEATRLELATRFGADQACGPDAWKADPARLTVVLDFVGTDATIAAGLAHTAPGGALGLIGAGGGSFKSPWYGSVPAEAEIFTFQGSSISDLHRVIDLVRQGQVQVLADVFDFDDVESAYAALDAGTLTGRAVVRIAGEP